jgi:hypothetical protein
MKRRRSLKSLRRKKRRPGSEEAPGELVSRFFSFKNLSYFFSLGDFVEEATNIVPDRIRIQSDQWIRNFASGSRRVKMTQKKRKKLRNHMF